MRVRAKKNRVTRFEKVKDLFAIKDENGAVCLPNAGKNPFWVEIGCGKGSFAIGTAEKNPNVQLLAVELISDVLLMAMEKAAAYHYENLMFLNENAANCDIYLPKHSVDRIYLNFSDPWPRRKNAKRRLTSPLFLQKYKNVLVPGGEIIMKTDNRMLFDYSLSTLTEAGFVLEKVLFDLHASELDATNVRTEYENNFSAKGFRINYLRAIMPL